MHVPEPTKLCIFMHNCINQETSIFVEYHLCMCGTHFTCIKEVGLKCMGMDGVVLVHGQKHNEKTSIKIFSSIGVGM